MGVDPETGKPTSTDIKLSSGDTRTGQDNRSLTLDIRKIRETQSFMRGQSAFSAALNAADSAAARAVLIAARVAQDTAIARFIGQIKAGQTIVGDDGESGGKSSGNKNLYGLLTKFGKVLGWIGLGESAANVIISAYKGGATGFWNALYEEGQGFAVGAAIGVAAIGITWAIPVAAPVIAGIGVVLTAVGVVSMGIHIYEMLTAVDSGKAPNPVSDSVLGVQQDRAPDFLAMMAESTPVEGKTILAFGSRETTGTNGNDLIFAANVNDVDAGEGNDIVFYYGADSKSGTARGGSGNDWVIAAGGQNATTVGGTGRDWIYNRSNGGIIYGDTIDGIDPVTGRKVEDSAANADNIWYSANTKVMDAQHHDVLKFYGLTLTGGNAEGGVAGLLAFGGIGAVTGLANFYSSLDANGKYDPARSV
ncbi:hypothetical protein BJ122_11719 [Rhodopseudomonas faecalis]|uniref:Uncharacterized protein n=2 Tax=Rhodopseudomonas faecalis TaxID=99655 RepID=A0A318TB33_9BRAD|nr:hypothetical protein BJ122_11719 [Rhodopseudomonas faecalis]